MAPVRISSRANMWTDVRFLAPVTGALLLVFLVLPSPTSHEERELASSRVGKSGGKLNKQVIEGHEVLWQVPGTPVKGVLFVAHGCNHQAGDFWPPSTDCHKCLGLPEEVLIRQDALLLGYAVVAVSSLDRHSRCWDVMPDPTQSVDGQAVVRILDRVREEEGLEGMPVYALGASSGGAFVLMLPHLMKLQGVVSQIMALPTQMLPSGSSYPPTLFVHMPRDTHTADMVQQVLHGLRAAGTPAAEIRVDPRAVTPDFLSSRVAGMGGNMAAAIVQALQKGGMLAEGGELLANPRQTTSQWHALLKKGVPGISKVSLQADASPISELLNLAWAGHEIVSDYTRVSLAWLEAGGEADINQLIREEQRQQGAGG